MPGYSSTVAPPVDEKDNKEVHVNHGTTAEVHRMSIISYAPVFENDEHPFSVGSRINLIPAEGAASRKLSADVTGPVGGASHATDASRSMCTFIFFYRLTYDSWTRLFKVILP